MRVYNIDITTLWEHNFCQIDTPDGFQNINTLVKKPQKRCYALLFSNGDIVECSEDHLIETKLGWVKSKDLECGYEIISKDSNVTFIDKKDIGIKDVYDLEVNHENHRYWSENISSHNTGKTSTANAIIRQLNGEALFINASKDRGMNSGVFQRIEKFAASNSFDDKIKIVVMDEFDNFTLDAQKAFRAFLDEFSGNCRFIFTGNYKEKIIEPLLSRLEVYDFNNFSKEQMVKPIFERLQWILQNENIQLDDPRSLVPIINTYYPKIRNMVVTLQKFSSGGIFKLAENELDDINVFDSVMQLVQASTYLEMINAVNKLNSPDNMYTYLYKNASKYFQPNAYPTLVVTIAKYQHMSDTVRDKQLNLAACLTELIRLRG